ncbi:glycosyltransferase [Vibrio parahaemolyticus]|nr:glycosyltransferase [Vibrio parahaemolyticus]EIA1587609.1 glycosyltransferase [Vibrio parahaemolyticus]
MFSVVIVTYNPKDALFRFVDELAKIKGVQIIIVDNASSSFDFSSMIDKVKLIKLKCNKGIAKAQNIGVEHSNNNEIFFFDQDSFISAQSLVDIVEYKKTSKLVKLGVIAPFVDKLVIKQKYIYDESNLYIDTDIIQSSGSLVSKDVYLSIGGMNEKLFIDCVEYDFNFRLRESGYKNLILKNIRMRHEFGKPGITRNKKEYVRHIPMRYFYSSRNGMFLAKQKYTPRQYRMDFALSFLRGIKSLLLNGSLSIKSYFYCFKGFFYGLFL